MSVAFSLAQARRQLTLFVSDNNVTVEKIRSQFNPVQHKLISAHVTLCREDELAQIDKVIGNVELLKLADPLKIVLDKIERFEDGQGVWLSSSKANVGFHELRRQILNGVIDKPRKHQPHITLMHPRSSTCTDEIFNQIKAYELPTEFLFDRVSLVEQTNGGCWTIMKEFKITTS